MLLEGCHIAEQKIYEAWATRGRPQTTAFNRGQAHALASLIGRRRRARPMILLPTNQRSEHVRLTAFVRVIRVYKIARRYLGCSARVQLCNWHTTPQPADL